MSVIVCIVCGAATLAVTQDVESTGESFGVALAALSAIAATSVVWMTVEVRRHHTAQRFGRRRLDRRS